VRVLVACEESGVVRDAFARMGWDAWSNDLQPARRGGQHIQKDCVAAMTDNGPWDIIIFHPPCTALSVSGNRHYGVGKPKHHERLASIEWTCRAWWNAKRMARIGACLENPASVVWTHIVADNLQWIQPYMFGHPEQKKTGLALDRLPRLKATNDVQLEMHCLPRSVTERVHRMAPSPTRTRDRSETYSGVAEAMSTQWDAYARAILAAEAA
jgi:hypothetical protein